MTQLLTPEEINAIREKTRIDFSISIADEHRIDTLSVISGWVGFATAVASVLLVWETWGGLVASIYGLTGIPMAIIGLVTHSTLKRILQRALVPAWSSYEIVVDQRIKEAKESRRNALLATADHWRAMDGHTFEKELAELLQWYGWRTEVTQRSGDGGVDIVCWDGESRIAVQCKRYAKPVGPSVIRELYGAIRAGHYCRGILAVTGGVTKGVKEFSKDKPIEILDLPQIVNLATKRQAGVATIVDKGP